MKNEYYFSEPDVINRIYDRYRYRHCIQKNSLLPEIGEQVKSHVSTLKKEGTLVLENYISPNSITELQQEFNRSLSGLKFNTPCLAQAKLDPVLHQDLIQNNLLATPEDLKKRGLAFEREEAVSLQQVVEDFQPSTLTVSMLEHSEAFIKAWLDPFILSIISTYMELVPYMVEAYVRRNYPAEYRVMNHYWHRDLNHKRYLLKIFVFLSDCSIKTGPHEFIRSTHTDYNILNGQCYYDDDTVNEIYPKGSPKIFVSDKIKAGTVVIEDTRGLHRASVPVEGYRDLGYAVFVPRPGAGSPAHYKLYKDAVGGLSRFQRAFVPLACLG